MKLCKIITTGCVALSAASAVNADPEATLGQVRAQFANGSWKGTSLFRNDAKPPAPTASAAEEAARPSEIGAAAPSQARPAAGSWGSKVAAPGAPAAPVAPAQPASTGGILSFLPWNQSLSGQPLSVSKRLDSAALGVALPVESAAAAARAASAAAAKSR
jgi:hypothetical protein